MNLVTRQFSPFLLDALVTPTLNGAPVAIPEGFSNPNRGPALIDELRFYTTAAAPPQGLLKLTASVGRQNICQNVSLEAICKPLDQSQENITSGDTSYTPSATSSPFVTHVWRFPKPLYLPGEDGLLNVKLNLNNNEGQFTNGNLPASMPVIVAMLGRSLPEGYTPPSIIDVPFASDYRTPVIQAAIGGGPLYAQSNTSDLRNNTLYKLYVQRFTYALLGASGTGTPVTDPTGSARDCTVRILGENGILGVRDQTPVGVLFHYGDRSWIVNSVLPPNGYYIVETEYQTFNVANPRLTIGMVGYRKVAIEDLGGAPLAY
jgi:hypothetical protein